MAAYLKLGDFEGNVTQQAFKGWIEIESYSWMFSVPVQTTVGSSANRLSAGKVQPGDMHLVKKQDKTSGKMMLEGMGGKVVPDATLAITTLTKSGAEEKYMEYKMSHVICSSFSTGGSQGGHEPMENFSLNFSKIEISQTTRDHTGAVQSPMRGSFDFVTSKGS